MHSYSHLKKVCPSCNGVGIKPTIRGLCDTCSGSGKVLMAVKDIVEKKRLKPFPGRAFDLKP